MQRKKVEGTTENLNLLTNKVKYIGFEMGEVPEVFKEFEPLNYRVPKVYDEKSYKIYKYIDAKDIDILVTPKDRLTELSERYKHASPLSTYMEQNKENLEKYAYFLRMLNQTNLEDIQKIEDEQEEFRKQIPFDIKFSNNFKWQIFYSDFAKKYFMLASTEENDNAPMFYLMKEKIEQAKNGGERIIFIPVSNEEYSEKILKKSEIEDIINYLWYFTKSWAQIYEVTDRENNVSMHIVGETTIFDKMTSKYKIVLNDKKQASSVYKLIKALFILGYELPSEYKFKLRVDKEGSLDFYFEDEKIEYETLPEFLKKQAIEKIKASEEVKNENKELKADIKDYQKQEKMLEAEYINKQAQIVHFQECKKSFIGKLKYFFKGDKNKEEEYIEESKNRMKDILVADKKKEVHFSQTELDEKRYTVEDVIKYGKELKDALRENKNIKLDINALKLKIASIQKRVDSANNYINEIQKHRKSIFEFWKYANQDESKMLVEGVQEEVEQKEKIKKEFNYEEDIETLSANIDSRQRELLSKSEQDAIFASNYVLDGINVVNKNELTSENVQKVESLLNLLKEEYKNDIEKIEAKDFDIFGNVSEDKTKIKTLKNNKHRETEKDKFKVLNINLQTETYSFIEKLKEICKVLEQDKMIEVPCNISLYKASNEKIEPHGFSKFSLNPYETLNKLEEIEPSKETYLYKINIPEKTKLVFYSNIIFFQNENKTLPLGMDISQEGLINMDLYNLNLKSQDEFNMNVEKDDFEHFIKNVKVFEYDLKQKEEN